MIADEIIVGRIAGAFGVRGELKCDPSNAGRALFVKGTHLRCERDSESWPVRIVNVRPHKRRLILRVEGVDDADAAAAYSGAVLYAPRSAIALSEGEYLQNDLVGCAVYDADGTPLGTVERVDHYPASDMLVVGGRMVPMVRAIVVAIDLDRQRIVIDPPAGLLD